MTTTTDTIRNGIDTATLFGTLDAIKANPELGKFQFRVDNRWIDGPHNRSTIKGFYGAGAEDTTRTETFELAAGEPQVLLGTDTGPNPAEALLHALAGCLTTSLVYVAAARGVRLTEVSSRLEGNMDVQGALGLSDDYRNGFEDVKVTFSIKGDASEEELKSLMERARARSAVFDIVSNGVPVDLEVETSS
ncbi:MAG: OsmC family protein [Actinobacteria bacterium]|nr:OsmC family protein [Actinomycetota bacterium]MCI0679620.1 OsmC family protein [Actinomycetota bacterium]